MYWYLVTTATNLINNVIVYNGSDPYTPPAGSTLKSSATLYNVGDTFNG